MPTHYLYGTILTSEAVAANNRGDNIGNTTTLQKVFLHDDVHTSVSAEAIRFALRYRFQLENEDLVNRSYGYEPESGKLKLIYKDQKVSYWNPAGFVYIDDDLMGFMDAEAAKKEKEDLEETEEDSEDRGETKSQKSSKRRTSKPEGKPPTVRPSPLAIGRAVSLRPYRGELSFNCVSGEKKKGQLSLYSAEMHTTEYQYSFGLNLGDVVKKEHIGFLIDAIVDPPQVAGNHARFAYDFSPASIVFRLTCAHSSRIQNCFEHDEFERTYTAQKLLQRLDAQDILASELIVGGEIYHTAEGERLRQEFGVMMFKGVYAAAHEVCQRIATLGEEYKAVASNTELVTGGAE